MMIATSRRLREERSLVVAFTGRIGGGSSGPFSSLNLSFNVGDDPDDVRVNRRAVMKELGLTDHALGYCEQVHGSLVLTSSDALDFPPKADGLLVSAPGEAALLQFADCVPVAVVSSQKQAAVALHAGRTGLQSGVISSGVEALSGVASPRDEMMAFIGPSIGPCCYEVSRGVADAFVGALKESIGEEALSVVVEATSTAGTGLDHPHLDLWRISELLLQFSGVPSENIWTMRTCTSCNHDKYFSYRADGGVTGRHGLVVAVA